LGLIVYLDKETLFKSVIYLTCFPKIVTHQTELLFIVIWTTFEVQAAPVIHGLGIRGSENKAKLRITRGFYNNLFLTLVYAVGDRFYYLWVWNFRNLNPVNREGNLLSISSKFYKQFLRQYSCAKKSQSQTITREKLHKALLYKKKAHIKCW